jgi:hypothetical protein
LGYENGLLEYNFFKYITPRPYHYFELWVNAIMYKVFGLNSLVVYTVSLPMFFNTLLFIAFLAIVELRKKITIGYILLAFTILLLSDVIIYISEIFPLFKGWMPLLESPKLLPVFLFLFTAIVLFLYNQKQNAYYALIIIPVLNMISLVAIWGTTGLFLLVDTIKKRKINWNYWIPFAAIVFFYFIYLIQGDSRSSAGGEDFHWGLFRLYITQPIVYTMAYIHIIALILLLDRKKVWGSIKKIRIVVPIAFFIPMTVSIFMRSYNYDATQFVTGIIPVMVYAAVVMTFLMIITSIQLTPSKKGLIIFFCGISLLMSADAYKRYIRKNTWAFEYESAILKQLPPSKEYRIGFYIGGNVTVGKGNNYVSGIVDAVTIPDVLDYYYNNVYHYSINKGNNGAQYSTDHTPFRDYYEKIKKQLATISDDDIRINFMKENSIEYVRIFQSALPSDYFLSNLILLAEDRMSGERFYKVK